MNILFLMPVVSHVRYQKRRKALEALGLSVTQLAFERPYYSAAEDINYVSLGKVNHGRYIERLPRLTKAFMKIRTHAKAHEVLYCFGLDMLLLAYLVKLSLNKPVKIIYEVGDIRSILIGTSTKSCR